MKITNENIKFPDLNDFNMDSIVKEWLEENEKTKNNDINITNDDSIIKMTASIKVSHNKFFNNYQTIGRFDVSSVGPKEFRYAVIAAKNQLPPEIAWHVETHDLEEYQQFQKDGGRFFVTEKGSTIAVKGDGEIISLCKAKGDHIATKDLIQYAIDRGGRYFTCFKSLERFFSRLGYTRMDEIVWNEDLAPRDWHPSYGEENVDLFRIDGLERVKERDYPERERPNNHDLSLTLKVEVPYQKQYESDPQHDVEEILQTPFLTWEEKEKELEELKEKFGDNSLSINERLKLAKKIQDLTQELYPNKNNHSLDREIR